MTREEAISHLQEMIGGWQCDVITAINMAIEALKQPEIVRCEDCEFREGSCCAYSAVYLWADGFCHRGRKKEEE